EGMTVSYQGLSNDSWTGVLPTLDRERARVMARASLQPRPQGAATRYLALAPLLVAAALGWRSLRLTRRLQRSERDRRRAADELNRRLSELFSLQELSYILSGSLQLDRIVEQVVRYAMRFLEAKGALVALAADGE